MLKPAAHELNTPASRLRWLYPIALAAVVIFASGRSQVAAPAVGHFDKIAHFAIFGLLATLVARCPGVYRFRYAIVAVSCFGIADELRQSFTPGRYVELADWVADTAGAVVAVTLYAFWPWYRRLLEFPLFRLRRPVPQAPQASPENVLSTDPVNKPVSAPTG